MTVTIRPLYDRGHFCPVCGWVTIYHYIGPQRERDGNVALHLWDLSECEATVVLGFAEERRPSLPHGRDWPHEAAARRYWEGGGDELEIARGPDRAWLLIGPLTVYQR